MDEPYLVNFITWRAEAEPEYQIKDQTYPVTTTTLCNEFTIPMIFFRLRLSFTQKCLSQKYRGWICRLRCIRYIFEFVFDQHVFLGFDLLTAQFSRL